MEMNFDKKTERKITFIAIGGLILLGVISFSIYYSNYPFVKKEFIEYLISTLIFNIFATYLIFIGNFKIDRFLEKRMPWDKSILKRLIVEYLMICFYSLSIMFVCGFLIIKILDIQTPGYLKGLLKSTFNIVLIITTAVIFYSFVRGWKTAKINIQKLEKETANARFEALKANIKPHFLFNSLNTLSSLIRINPALAEEYSSGLSDVYRYILKRNDDTLVCIKEEINFLKTYLNLQNIRFGKSLNYDFDINSNITNKLIPSLSLQLIVENALKHNIIDKTNKLHISIKTKDNWLIITNNYQPKLSKPKSNGFGLKNITERYSYFTDEQVIFEKTDKKYIVKIPLLNE